jgi:glycine cleavage system regulatory protein
LATIVARHGGNWAASRMARLGGQFAGIVQVDLPPDEQAAAIAELTSLEASGLTVVAVSDRPATTTGRQELFKIDLIGHDRPGIVRDISRALAGFAVNVEELQTEVVSAPMSGEPLFQARATVRVPDDCPLATLRQRLGEIASNLGLEIELHKP